VTEAAGGCLCGGVRYRLAGDLRGVVFCHCSRCRRFHGHVGAYTAVAREGLSFERDGTLSWHELDGSRRGFCTACGSSLFWSREELPTVSVAVGTLDEPTGLVPQAHGYVEDAGDYYELPDDGLERHLGSGA
jgi:hypothetical protein